MSTNSKIALISATAAWCIDQYAGLRRKGSRFDAALSFDFMHFVKSIWDGVEWWQLNKQKISVEPNRNMSTGTGFEQQMDFSTCFPANYVMALE